ncbi:uncharacterized protein C19orf47-like [Xenia sp. Carnegie-2017]|uniref:uncharacterized protein C19orf47-like n=1 Tax=Xenia sp. Carnegie-2017 TaxID=2897299 RepID=UPI001F04D4D0|nr:uncharacterized protein C19orf47-like [Xenia sp. Carnegie-2017]
MAEKDLLKWNTFFNNAGIPKGPASKYSALFCNHRIKDDLLGDLTKEILNDIGITVMGDVMSILKHSKVVHAKLEREKSSNQLMQDSDVPSVNKIEVPLSVKKKKIPIKGPVKVRTEVQPAATKSSSHLKIFPNAKKTLKGNDSSVTSNKKTANVGMSLSDRFAMKAKHGSVRIDSSGNLEINRHKKQQLEGLNLEEKVQTNASSKRKSAFERLGDEETMSKDMNSFSHKIKVAKLGTSTKSPPSKIVSLTKNQTSVFKRLGQSSQSAVNKMKSTQSDSLAIRTLNGSPIMHSKKTSTTISNRVLPPLKPIRAVQPVKPISSSNVSSRKSVFDRLGRQT